MRKALICQKTSGELARKCAAECDLWHRRRIERFQLQIGHESSASLGQISLK
jgi:hypothetical protein